MFSIYDGRTQFFQWDLDRKLVVNDPTIEKVHFCNRTGVCSLVRRVYEVNGKYFVDVPNVILQESYRVNVYGYDVNYTKHSASFNIVPRTKPEDYVYTDAEITELEAIEERLNNVERNGASTEAIEEIVENYLKENPIEVGATEEQAAQIETNKEDIAALKSLSSTYATEEYVNTAIGNVDLSEYATTEALNAAVAELEAKDVEQDEALKTYKSSNTLVIQNINRKLDSIKLDDYALKSEIPDVSAFQTAEEVEAAIYTAIAAITDGEEVSY